MKKILILFISLGFGLVSSAQQDPQYTQFMFNKVVLNPGYAGSQEVPCISCLHRSQWVGIDGAPNTQTASFHTPLFRKRVGFGLSLMHDGIGPTDSWYMSMAYAYRIQMKNKRVLSFGMQGSVRRYSVNWDETEATHEGDFYIPTGSATKMLPNFGAGVYYYTPKFYAGLSVPYFFNGDLSFHEDFFITDFSREEVHAFFMAGGVIRINHRLKAKPALLAKYVPNAPFDLDLHGSLIFYDRLWAGLTYRLGGSTQVGFGESIDLVLQFQFTDAIKIGLAYDFTLSELKRYDGGTFELMAEYCFTPNRKRLTNPRYF